MIAIVDYEAGNLTSVAAAVAALGLEATVTSRPADIRAAERIVFPGVGAARSAMRNLSRLGLAEPLRQAVASGKRSSESASGSRSSSNTATKTRE